MTTPTTRAVSGCISRISAEICAGGALGLLGELADLVGDDREAAPCSPARAASIAAFSASRLVCSAIPVIVPTMPPMRSERLVSSRDRLADAEEEAATSRIASLAELAASTPSSATARASPAAWTVAAATSALVWAERAAPSTASRVTSTRRTWRSAPAATSPTASAISVTARPVCWEVPAICATRRRRAGAAGERPDRLGQLSAR